MFLELSMETSIALLWFAIIIIASVIEFSTTDLTSIWFAGGALVSFIVALIWPAAIVAQIVVFIVATAILIFEVRPAVKGYLTKNDVKTNADRVIGKIAVCTKAFKTGDRGEVKIDGKYWTAVSNEDISLNDKVEVLSIDGVKLVVRKS